MTGRRGRGNPTPASEPVPIPSQPPDEPPQTNGAADENGLDLKEFRRSTGPEETGAEFNLEDYRYSATVQAGTGTTRVQLTIPTGQPKRSTFFRTDPRPEMQFPIGIYELEQEGKIGKDTFLIGTAVEDHPLLLGKIKPAVIRVILCRPSILKLWAVRCPVEQTGGLELGGRDSWIKSRWDGVRQAEKVWLRLDINESGSGYDALVAETQWPDPEWPDEPLAALVQKAWPGKFTNRPDHALFQYLAGKV
jgi:hypothetical protein